MNSDGKILACHECDLMIKLPKLIEDKQRLSCPRCKHKITVGHSNVIDHVIALSLSCLAILIFSNSFYFLSFSSAGKGQSISLLDIAYRLFEDGFILMSSLTYLFVFIFPLIYLIALVLLLVPIKMNKTVGYAVGIGKLIHYLLPWIMVEVFLMGVFVALIKIVALADVSFGPSFWGYILFTTMFIYINSIVDSYKLWYWIENARK